MIDKNLKAINVTLTGKIEKLQDDLIKAQKRMFQLDLKSQQTLNEVSARNSQFGAKVEEVTDRWVGALTTEKKVQKRVKEVESQMSMLQQHFQHSNNTNERALSSLNEIVHCEVKDIKASNNVYQIELERNQALFRELQREALDNLDERKVQNESLLEHSRKQVIDARNRQRRMSALSGRSGL